MAEDTVDRLLKEEPTIKATGPCVTKNIVGVGN